jgi:hypothetical protein
VYPREFDGRETDGAGVGGSAGVGVGTSKILVKASKPEDDEEDDDDDDSGKRAAIVVQKLLNGIRRPIRGLSDILIKVC